MNNETFLIEENDQTSQKIALIHEKMYTSVAKIFANELFDELVSCGILDDDRIKCYYKKDTGIFYAKENQEN